MDQQDPVGGSLGDLNSANRYVYANDDPVNEVDPSGKASIPGNFCSVIIEEKTKLTANYPWRLFAVALTT